MPMPSDSTVVSSTPPCFSAVADGVWVLDPRVGADTMAVLGAMMSRTPDLGLKWDALIADVLAHDGTTAWDFRNPPRRILTFLQQNLAGYSHASIASMAKAIFVYVSGMGWPGAWLLEDFPLFDGQEVSTRAVDAGTIPGAQGPNTPCRYAPPGLEALHAAWMERYARATAAISRGGYQFDDARVLLPGTVPSGVVITQDVRAVARHLDHLRGLGAFGAALAAQAYTGLAALAPVSTAAIGQKPRTPHASWRIGTVTVDDATRMGPADHTSVALWDRTDPAQWTALLDRIPPRSRANTHLDPLWRHAPRVDVRIVCTIAAARDFHRHRPSMPWSLNIVLDGATGAPVFAPWYPTAGLVDVPLWQATCEAFQALGGYGTPGGRTPEAQQWEALHALPFGALVQLSAVMTLPDALYMLELRATTKGANAEYRAQAVEGLRRLCAAIPASVVAAERLDGALRQPVSALI